MTEHTFKTVEEAVEFLGDVTSDIQAQLAQSMMVSTSLVVAMSQTSGASKAAVMAGLGVLADQGNQFAQNLIDGLDGQSPVSDQKSSTLHLRIVSDEDE